MKQEYDFSGAKRGLFRRAAGALKLPGGGSEDPWQGPQGALGRFVLAEASSTLKAYRAQPHLVTEHANQEYDTAHGGYAHRQLYELIQNGADALAHEGTGGSILVRLTDGFLYCADDGKPLDEEGVTGLMFAHMSSKRGTAEIGRFGMGFKSVLGVTDAPEFYSRSGSIRFNRTRAAEQIQQHVGVKDVERYPTLRLPEPTDAAVAAAADADLRELLSWATNVVRLPLAEGAFADLATQVDQFPPEFLLFVPHVRYLTLEGYGEVQREFTLQQDGDELRLDTGRGSSRWRCYGTTHTLSADARADSRTLDETDNVQIAWAAPLDRLSEPGRFWAFFPTQTASLLAGILNAPWKTNEDRQNLLAGPYNNELIDAAASMIAAALPSLAIPKDPARHLDALPRREEAGDGEHSKRLRARLVAALASREVVPDQDGRLRAISQIQFAPEELTTPNVLQEPLDQWTLHEQRPRNWLHHAALTRNRLARVNQLLDQGLPRASLAEWLVALKNEWPHSDAIEASSAAIMVAALLPTTVRRNAQSLGKIVMTQGGRWEAPDPDKLFIQPIAPAYDYGNADHLVHIDLASDEWVARDLRSLGLREMDAASIFSLLASQLPQRNQEDISDSWWRTFWRSAARLNVDDAVRTLSDREDRLRVCTLSGEWQPLDSVLLPGGVVPPDGSRDARVAVDVRFHAAELDLLGRVGITGSPREKDLSSEPWFGSFLRHCRESYKSRDLPRKPRDYYLVFRSTRGVGPLEVLPCLSDEGRVRYVEALLAHKGSYQSWQMGHETQLDVYPEVSFRSPTLSSVAQHGRIRCAGEIMAFRDALGRPPPNPLARTALLEHPLASRIREFYPLAEPRYDTKGEEDPVPLLDVWPGAPAAWSAFNLVGCEHIAGDDGSEPSCVRVDSNVLLVRTDRELDDIKLVASQLSASLDDTELSEILRYVAPREIEKRRAIVREQSGDAARLLCAVGESALRQRLPTTLLDALEAKGTALAGLELARAAIATFHTSALSEYRFALGELGPPSRWAGSRSAVKFVQSLGFAPEWAGERGLRRDPFVEVEGPFSLPALHAYQQCIVDRIVRMVRNGSPRRGMVSLPTGAGKTRVAVQAIVHAICGGAYTGGVLWVADRDELCEQAVEAWRQVWAAIGLAGTPLRISRMWGQQPAPLATSELHVVVATIQTLNPRLSKEDDAYRFVTDFDLVVFDEAHRSIAPSYTSVMSEIGLTQWRRQSEPFLLGLTATPYRGHDEAETGRLVGRYGSNRLDNGAFRSGDPVAVVRELQAMRVLAQADHETIDGGDFSLTEDEAAEMEDAPAWLPRRVEERIAGDTTRTLGIVQAYEFHVANRNPDWPTLIFATSVEHAQTVAALLNTRGIKARSVSGNTDRAARRSVVEDFRAGEINVLVNYGVFREGFDAPKTRAIVVARPVYSPNLYFQMIGRGLRGPKNGGSDRCLIINVQDNIHNFNRELAFTDLDWLWA